MEKPERERERKRGEGGERTRLVMHKLCHTMFEKKRKLTSFPGKKEREKVIFEK